MKRFISRIIPAVLVVALSSGLAVDGLAEKLSVKGNEAPKVISEKVVRTQPGNSSFALEDLQPLTRGSLKPSFGTIAPKAPVMPSNVVCKAASDVPVLYGTVIYNTLLSSDYPMVGLYQLPTSAGPTTLLFPGPECYAGVCIGNVYYMTFYKVFAGNILSVGRAWNIETGELISSFDVGNNALTLSGYSLDPTSGEVYGITFNDDLTGKQISRLSLSESGIVVSRVADIDGNWNSTVIDRNGQMYGIGYTSSVDPSGANVVTSSSLYKIDKYTGATTLVGNTGQIPQYNSSACIDLNTNRMFWNLCPSDNKGYLCEVDLATGEATPLFRFSHDDQVMGMFATAPQQNPATPGECSGMKAHFERASLNGYISFKAPAGLFDGSAAKGTLKVTALCDGIEAGSVDGVEYGAEAQVSVTVPASGLHNFTLYATNDAGDGPMTKLDNIFVGYDTPVMKKPQLSYTGGNMQLSWQPVDSSVSGGFVDVSNVSYNVYRQDGSVAASDIRGTSYSEAVTAPEDVTEFFYYVSAVAEGLESSKVSTNKVVLGHTSAPFNPDFNVDGLYGWTVIDGNNDGYVWYVNPEKPEGNEVRVHYNYHENLDDWLITPPVLLEAGNVYRLTFTSNMAHQMFIGCLEVKMGKGFTADDMTETLVPPTDITVDPVTFSEIITPKETGCYSIGFHGISEPNQHFLYISNVSISEGVSDTAPEKVSDLTFTADPYGALSATIAFRAPDKTTAGKPLSSLDKIEVKRGGQVVKTFVNPTPGESLSFVDNLASRGEVSYSVVAINEAGSSSEATCSGFVGFDKPAPTKSVTVTGTENIGEVKVSWEPVLADIHGIQYRDEPVRYIVSKSDASNGDWEIISDNVDDSKIVFTPLPAGEQKFMTFSVYTKTAEGVSSGTISDMVAVGTPYTGFAESFADNPDKYIWQNNPIGSGSVIIMDQNYGVPAQDNDNKMLGIYSNAVGDGAEVTSGLISLDNIENPYLSFYVFDLASIDQPGNVDENEVKVAICSNDDNVFKEVLSSDVDELCRNSSNGWGKVNIPLGEYAGKIIRFKLTGITRSYSYTMFDNFQVGQRFNKNISATSISAPDKVKPNEKYKVEVMISNNSDSDVSLYDVEFYTDNKLESVITCKDLPSGGIQLLTFTLTMPILAEEPVTHYVRIVCEGDESAADDVSSVVTVQPIVPALPRPNGLSAEVVDGWVNLSWNTPDMTPVPVEITEDFEKAESWADHFSDWTFVDKDQSTVGGLAFTIPCIAPFSTKGSFWIWDADEIGGDRFIPHSGSKYLFAMYNALITGGSPDRNSDWAISPELSGEAQTISFYARRYSPVYAEKVSVYYSTGSLDPDDFIKIEGAGTDQVPYEWTEYTADLPEGARYFALVNESHDCLILMIDDVTYTPLPEGDFELVGYNVYRDGVRINANLVKGTSYVDITAVEGETYSYKVTAVYIGKGESGASNAAIVGDTGVDCVSGDGVSVSAATGKIIVANAQGLPVNVASVNGVVLFNGKGDARTEIAVAPGVYIVKAGGKVVKLIVR